MSLAHRSVATIKGPEFINLTPLDINPLMSACEIKVFYIGENRNKSSQMSFIQGVDNTAGINSFLANLEAQQANQKLRQTISQYNNAIDAANQNISANYDKLNLELLGNKLNMLNAAAQARDASDTARGQAISTNRTNAANQIGKVGLDATNFELQRILGESGAYGVLNEALLKFINSQLGGKSNA